MRIAIVGAGGHGRVVLDILLQRGRDEVVGFLDGNRDLHGRRVDGIEVLGSVENLPHCVARRTIEGAVIAIGDNGTRRGVARQVDRLGIPLVSAVHPSATVAHSATLGRNVVVAAGVVVCAHCQIGDSVILNTGCIIDHQTMVGEGCHVCPGVRIAGRVVVEPGAFVGIGATVLPRVTIGFESIVGAGAVVTESIPPMTTCVGVPARPIRNAELDEDAAAMLLPARVPASGFRPAAAAPTAPSQPSLG